MAEITLRLRHDPKTGRRELVVHLESDSDVLSHEHERDHRALVESLIGSRLDDDVSIVIERVEKGGEGTATETPAARKRAEPTTS